MNNDQLFKYTHAYMWPNMYASEKLRHSRLNSSHMGGYIFRFMPMVKMWVTIRTEKTVYDAD
jgi:hypothetical protein